MKKLRILVDAQPMAEGQKAGIGYYSAGLISAIAQANPQSVEIICHYFDFMSRRHPELPNASNITYRVSKIIPRQIVNQLRRWGLAVPFEILCKARGDLIIYPGFNGPPSFFKVPIIPVIHDLAYLDLPEQVSSRKQNDMEHFIPALIKQAPFVITVSRATKAALKKHYPWLDVPIVVEHIPPPPIKKPSEADAINSLSLLKIKKPFILFIGTLEPRKNLVNLIHAYSSLPDGLRQKYSLVLAGGKGWNDDEIQTALVNARSENLNIIETGYITDRQKSALLSKASMLILPSFYEGYGMPLLEAMSMGLPTAASDITVFREVAGEASIYFNPNSPQEIARAMQKVLLDTKLRERLRRAGNELASQLSWQQLAESLLRQIRKRALPDKEYRQL